MAKTKTQGSGEIVLLLHLLDEAFDKKAWHGPGLWGALRGIDQITASARPAPGRHNVWELALHAAYWKYAVARRLTGEKRGSFPLRGSNWFARPDPSLTGSWPTELRMLREQHDHLREVVALYPPDRLRSRAPGSAQTAIRMIAGVAAHDLYHAGQVSLTKRLVALER